MDLPPGIDCCVANIPYQVPLGTQLCRGCVRLKGIMTVFAQISSPVVEKLLSYRPLMKRAVIMFQLEFAERMMAL
jgi:16S rRNA A1518/A1519 N6-dimethyltransferase RsmA/KsgA/DIM1 with predicted DNA glycosylase/AP lyase activity